MRAAGGHEAPINLSPVRAADRPPLRTRSAFLEKIRNRTFKLQYEVSRA